MGREALVASASAGAWLLVLLARFIRPKQWGESDFPQVLLVCASGLVDGCIAQFLDPG